MEILQIIGQVLFGGFFIISGANHLMKMENMTGYASSKNLPSPKASVIISGIALILGGLGVLVGMYMTTSLWILIAFLVIASFSMHRFWSVSSEEKQAEMTNFMKNLALAGAALMLLF